MRRIVILMLCLLATPCWGQGALENPVPNSYQSGIGVLSGWKCTAGTISAQFDGGPSVQPAYGTVRGDTQTACGDTNNGFGVLVNWNLLSSGQHIVRLFDNGVLFAEASFTVVTTGQQFLQGLAGAAIAPQFPTPNLDTVLMWQESLQNFVIIGSTPHVPTGGGERAQTCTEHRISDLNDQLIQLDDGSIWEVSLGDQFKTTLWFLFQRIVLCDLHDDFGDDRTMINLDTSGFPVIKVSTVR